jgi:hypothetical protein
MPFGKAKDSAGIYSLRKSVAVPPGAKSGDTIQVEVHPGPPKCIWDVSIPPGVAEGKEFVINISFDVSLQMHMRIGVS